MALELATAEQAIVALISGGGYVPAGIPIAKAPYQEANPRPAIIFKLHSAMDLHAFTSPTIKANCFYQIVAEAQGDTSEVVYMLAAQIHQSLDNKPFSNANGIVLSITRTSFIDMPYRSQGGKQYQMMGGIYRIETSSIYAP